MEKHEDYLEELKQVNVLEFTSVNPQVISPDESFDNIYQIMFNSNIRHLPVLDGESVVGIISQRDIIETLEQAEKEVLTAKDFMNVDPFTVFESTPLDQVCFSMSQEKIGSAIVLDNQHKLAGIFTTTDALNALVEILRGDIEIETQASNQFV